MIRSFADRDTAALWQHERVPGLDPRILRAALRKLVQVHAATSLQDLRVPPGNRLELLRGGRQGQHSIRVNDQWRICFRWKDGGAEDVELVDYH